MSAHEEEHATQTPRSIGSFPAEWGPPRGRPLSEERVAWVRSKVEQFGSRSPLSVYRKLAAADGRLLAILRAAELEAKRRGPLDVEGGGR